MNGNFVYLSDFFLPNRGDHYRRELSTVATGRPVSYATRDEFRNTFQILKFMAFDPLRYFVSLFCSSFSPSLLLWLSFSFPFNG